MPRGDEDDECALRSGVDGSAKSRRCVWGPLATHVPESKQPGKEGIRLSASAYTVPIPERLLCPIHQIEHLLPRESAGGVVVRFVTGLLKVDKRCRNPNEFGLEFQIVQTGGKSWRDSTTRELLRYPLHIAVVEGACQTATERRPIYTGKHAIRRFVDQQVKERVVRCRGGSAKAGLQRPAGFPDGKLPGLPQQVCVQSHGVYSVSEAPRNRT